jgi:hypothetical protein
MPKRLELETLGVQKCYHGSHAAGAHEKINSSDILFVHSSYTDRITLIELLIELEYYQFICNMFCTQES